MNREVKKHKYNEKLEKVIATEKECCFTCYWCGYAEKQKEYYCKLRFLRMSANTATNMICLSGRWEVKDEH